MRSRFLVVLFRPDEVPAELGLSLERREAEVAGTYDEQRAHRGRAPHRSSGSRLTPAPREEGGGVCVSPGTAYRCSGVSMTLE